MKNNLYYFKFNNYYNRKIKRYSSLDSYLRVGELLQTNQNINFIAGDGIFTNQIINWKSNDNQPDYLIVTDGENNNIISRWFVIKNEVSSGNQFNQTLKRDTIADNYEKIIDADSFIEKATLLNSDPAIYNKENLTFNQIKKQEILLKDKTECAWLVGYIARDYSERQEFSVNTYFDEEYSTIATSPYADYIGTELKSLAGSTFLRARLEEHVEVSPDWGYETNYKTLDIFNAYPDAVRESKDDDSLKTVVVDSIENTEELMEINARRNDWPDGLTSTPEYISVEEESFLKSKKDKIIKIGDKYYRVDLKIDYNQTRHKENHDGSTNQLYFNKLIGEPATTKSAVYTTYFGNIYLMHLLPLPNNGENGKAVIDFSKPRKKVLDQPFDMFCIPYAEFKIKGITEEITTTKNNNLSLAMGIASLAGVVYDVQLLPYCPLTALPQEHFFDLKKLKEEDYSAIFVGAHMVGAVLWCERSSFEFNVDHKIYVDNPKITNETELYRLCSPNYNGIFEFNPAKNMLPNNKLAISYFNVDCTYRPFQPYIHVAFDFKGLYGNDFDDARGLICGGDFSLPSATDTWAAYEIQNKNYKNSFDRQIESQELGQKWSRISDVSNIVTGSIVGGTLGSLKNGPVAAVGAAVGAINSGVNLAAKEALRRDALDLTKDNFNFQMQNIQALPNSLNKVGSFNKNNKIFPFLEVYGATDVEVDALKSKLYFNGMSVFRIGKIKEFLRPEESYIKAKLIRIEGLNDFNEVNDAANELNQGVFIK